MAKKKTKKTAKKAVAKKKTTKKVAKKVATKKSPSKAKKADINGFRRHILSKAWRRDEAIREANETFESYELEEFNNKQIAFNIEGTRVPSEGFFTVR